MNKLCAKDEVLIIAATNQIDQLDEACIRRFNKRIFVGLPDSSCRKRIFLSCLKNIPKRLTDEDLDIISEKMDGFSGCDIKQLCQDISMMPVREILSHSLPVISQSGKIELRELIFEDILQVISVFQTAHRAASNIS